MDMLLGAAVLISGVTLFLVLMALGRIHIGCMVFSFFGGLVVLCFIWYLLHASAGGFGAPDVGMMMFGAGAATLLCIFFIVVGLPAGKLLGNMIFDPLYNPKDTRKVKKDHSIAMSHVKFGKYHEAIEQFQKDFSEDPKDKHILWEMATIYAYNLNEYSRAVSCLDQILLDKRKGLEDLWLLASFRSAELNMKNLDNPGRAREIMQSVAERYPDTHHSRMAEVWLWGAGINGQFDDKYYDIKIEEDYYRSVNEKLVARWIGHDEILSTSLVLNPETGKWDHLGDLEAFKKYWA